MEKMGGTIFIEEISLKICKRITYDLKRYPNTIYHGLKGPYSGKIFIDLYHKFSYHIF